LRGGIKGGDTFRTECQKGKRKLEPTHPQKNRWGSFPSEE
jgi:hypothetical protein